MITLSTMVRLPLAERVFGIAHGALHHCHQSSPLGRAVTPSEANDSGVRAHALFGPKRFAGFSPGVGCARRQPPRPDGVLPDAVFGIAVSFDLRWTIFENSYPREEKRRSRLWNVKDACF